MHTSLAKPVLPYSDPDLVTIGWNDRAVGPKRQDLYLGGYCEECGAAIGPRNEQLVVFSSSPKADTCGFEERMSNLNFVSAVLLSALSEKERAEINPRPVTFEKSSAKRREFFEVAGEPKLSQVGVREGKYLRLASVECAKCGYRAFSCSHPELKDTARASNFVARSDLPDDLDSAFLIRDTLGRSRICMSHKRFCALGAGLSSLWPGRLFCLEDGEVDRRPNLALLAELD